MELKGKRSKKTLLSCCFRRRKALDISKTVAEATDSVRMMLPVILLPAHPASFAHKFLFQRVPASPRMQ